MMRFIPSLAEPTWKHFILEVILEQGREGVEGQIEGEERKGQSGRRTGLVTGRESGAGRCLRRL